PLAIGNEYQFYFPDSQGYRFCKIEKDTTYPNGKTYFVLPSPFDFVEARIDSNGNLFSAYHPWFGGEPEEHMYFKADVKLGEVWPVAWNFNPVIDTGYAECFFIDTVFLFGDWRSIKGIRIFDFSYTYYRFWLAEGIGLVREAYDDGTINLLTYAKINGIEYGTLVSVNDNEPVLPEAFSVSQNYPNPFNGISNIDIILPQTSSEKKIKLIVYNILGSILFEQEYPANGKLTIAINTDNIPLSSGTYFYAVLNGDKRITKKFTLIK